jgi:hypothetical protein
VADHHIGDLTDITGRLVERVVDVSPGHLHARPSRAAHQQRRNTQRRKRFTLDRATASVNSANTPVRTVEPTLTHGHHVDCGRN